VLPGWEGSAGDSRVLRDALRHQYRLQIPNGNIMIMIILYFFNGSMQLYEFFFILGKPL
jgi:hypothetical protein